MRVGFDASVIALNQAGSGVYASSLLRSLRALNTETECVAFSVRQEREMSASKTLRTRVDTIYRDILWTHALLPRQAESAEVDLLHMPAGVIPLHSHCPTVVTILDTTVLQSPANFPFWHRNYSRLLIPFSAKHASIVLTISNHSKRDIASRLQVAPEKIIVTHLAASEEFRLIPESDTASALQKYSLSSYLLCVSTLEPRKNMVRLLQAYGRVHRDRTVPLLVHVGPKGWHYAAIFQEVERLGLEDSVRFLGRVPLSDLVALYNAASALIYPSLYEGFGLPPLEAMACGCPVVASNAASLPEVVGDAGILIDPCDVDALANAMCTVLGDKGVGGELRERGLKRAKLFSWERCAQETVSAYHRAVAAPC